MADEESSNDKGKAVATQPEKDPVEQKDVSAMLKALGLGENVPGAIVGGKKQKEMSGYKFWQTQPVPTFEESQKKIDSEGPIREVQIEKVRKEPDPLIDQFEWCLLDLTDDKEVGEVYDLLSNHYVEDDEAMFRFNYSKTFFNWALKSPGWKKTWHIGVRTKSSGKLVGTIFGVPVDLRIRDKTLRSGEVNYLCVHKKLRGHRLAPVLIKEMTRRFNLEGIFQAIYTAGIVIPSPISTCRYFHRTIDFEKLYEVGFSRLPPGVSQQRQKTRFYLPPETLIKGFRPMERKDLIPVGKLLAKYLERFAIAQVFNAEEIDHWMLHEEGQSNEAERVVWAYVVEDEKGKITDVVSYYKLESTIIKKTTHNHKTIKAAYLYYYATDVAFEKKADKDKLKKRLNDLIKDALITAKKVSTQLLKRF
jgi:glycylpeptide N-tetradecanoyltransferase